MHEEDLDDELTSHIQFQVRKHMAAGLSEREARRLARMEFGGLDVAKEQCRDVDPWHWADASRRNLKHALRALAKSPAFSLIAIAILAVGIGATVGTFSLVDALLFRPLALARPNELVQIASAQKDGRLRELPSTILDPLKHSAWLSGVCGFNTSYEGAEASGIVSPIGILGFTGDCFRTLGLETQLGRAIVPDDDRPGTSGVAVITGELWRGLYGGRADVLGKRIQMPGAAFTIVGVAEDRFTGLLLGFPAGIIVLLHQEPNETGVTGRQDWWYVNVVGRRAPGVSAQQAAAGLAAQSGWLLEQSVPPRFNAVRRRLHLATHLITAPAASGVDYFLRNRFGQPLLAVFGICAAILAIACVNLAGLMLARALGRRREVAVRLALGASRAHVAGMLALEGALLVAAGAALSTMVALAVDRLVLARGAEMFGNFGMRLGFDSRTTIFFALTVLAIMSALAAASAWQARRLCRQGSLHQSGRRVSSGNSAVQRMLIAAQIALTLALVAGAGFFGASLRSFYSLNLGVETQHVWDAMLSAHPARYQNFEPGPYYRDLVRQVETIPGIAGAVLANFVPLYSTVIPVTLAAVDGPDPGQELQVLGQHVSDGFFSLMGMRMVAGRDFRRDEPDGAENEAIVSLSLAGHLGGAASLLGRHIRVGTAPAYQRLLVVGVASDAQFSLADPSDSRPFNVYIDTWQHPAEQAGYPVLLLKTTGGTLPAAMLRQTVDRAGREYVERVRSLDAEKDGALVENRVVAYLSGVFGLLALVLAATGLFGLLSYQVASRTGEIGIRMALGARGGQIQWMIVRQIGDLVAGGAAAGVALSLAEGRAIGGLLFGVHAGDPRTLAGAVLLLAATALLAAWLPARRAASVDPVVALRLE